MSEACKGLETQVRHVFSQNPRHIYQSPVPSENRLSLFINTSCLNTICENLLKCQKTVRLLMILLFRLSACLQLACRY